MINQCAANGLLQEAVSELAQCRHIEAVFNDCFRQRYRCELVGGADEPYYQPGEAGDLHRVYYREDFPRSALHEAAHWCVAGEQRRQLVDYGYWYEPDGRSVERQREFERVEATPQAIEWFFSLAAGLDFQVSIDNLGAGKLDEFPFKLAVWQRAKAYQRVGLPPRAEQLFRALCAANGVPLSAVMQGISLRALCR